MVIWEVMHCVQSRMLLWLFSCCVMFFLFNRIAPLLLALVLVELQNTCKKIEQENAWETQHMLYFWKAECSRMSNMTFPCVNTIQLGRSPFNSSPQCKKLFTLSFQAKFLKIWFTKVTATSIKSYVAVNFFVPQSQVVLGACFGP